MTQKALRRWIYRHYKESYPHSVCAFEDTNAFFLFAVEAVYKYQQRKNAKPIIRLNEQIAPYKALSLSDLPAIAISACVRAVALNPLAKIWLCGSFVNSLGVMKSHTFDGFFD